MKKCSACHLVQEDGCYNKKGLGLQPDCKTCSRQKSKAYYANNVISHKKTVLEIKKRNCIRDQEYVFEWLKQHPCVVCGEKDLMVLEFDHLFDKKLNVTTMCQRGHSLATLQEEINKCQVLCSNCHKRKTYKENNSFRYRYSLNVT